MGDRYKNHAWIYFTLFWRRCQGEFSEKTPFSRFHRYNHYFDQNVILKYIQIDNKKFENFYWLWRKNVLLYIQGKGTPEDKPRGRYGSIQKLSKSSKGGTVQWQGKLLSTRENTSRFLKWQLQKRSNPQWVDNFSANLNLNRKGGEAHGNWRTCLPDICGIARRLPLR